jgi:hypothetical protein
VPDVLLVRELLGVVQREQILRHSNSLVGGSIESRRSVVDHGGHVLLARVEGGRGDDTSCVDSTGLAAPLQGA